MHFIYTINFCANQTHSHCGKWRLCASEGLNTIDQNQTREGRRFRIPLTQVKPVGDFATIEAAATAIAHHQDQQNKFLKEATPEPAPLDPGARLGGVRDMALQKIK